MNKIIAFGLIDAQRGFMPEKEGNRLGVEGFGELPINGGEKIVPYVNRLLGGFAVLQLPVFYTQDWHPAQTAHFAEEPNYNTTWPVHCVANTPGAKLHPAIRIGADARQFLKGFEPLQRGEDDTSYSGYNGVDFDRGQNPVDFLKDCGVTHVVLGGLALDYCVKATALDLVQKGGYEVTIVADATEAVAQETGFAAIDELEAAGVKFAATDEILRALARM